MPYDLYILYSQKIDRYYIGISSNAEKRLFSHNNFPKGWTAKGIPWILVYKKSFKPQGRTQYQKIL